MMVQAPTELWSKHQPNYGEEYQPNDGSNTNRMMVQAPTELWIKYMSWV